MDSRLARCEAVFSHARLLAGHARAAHVEQACAGDAELQALVWACLVAAEKETGTRIGSVLAAARQRSIASVVPQVEDFEVLYRLGSGGGGTVYLAAQKSLPRRVALKVFQERMLPDAKMVARFHREAQVIASLNHPNVVKVFAHGQQDELHWFAMEYVDGHDVEAELSARRQRQPSASLLPEFGSRDHVRAVVGLCASLADALHHAHVHGVVHRDVKPGNILLERDTGRAVLTDFGLARGDARDRITSEGSLMGTVRYMAPEQWSGSEVDARTDVFALGLVMFELLGGRAPFSKVAPDRPSLWDVPASLRRSNRAVAPEVELACAKALRRQPQERYASAADFADDLRRILRHEPVQAKPLPLARRTTLWARRHPVVLAFFVAASLAAVLTAWLMLDVGPSVVAELRFHGVGSQPAVLRLVTLDQRTCVPVATGDPIALPTPRCAVPAGYYRFCVQLASGERREYTRLVAPRHDVQHFVFDIYPPPSVADGLTDVVTIPGQSLLLQDGMQHGLDQAPVTIAAFAIERTEVSNRQYRRFLAATNHAPPVGWEMVTPEHDDLPVTRVSWEDARAYAEWCGRRLPSYAEWVLAARGKEGRRFPRGGESCPEANIHAPRGAAVKLADQFLDYVAKVQPVHTCAAAATTENGLLHVLGNVAEWTETIGCNHDGGSWLIDVNQRFAAGGDWCLATYSVSDLRCVDRAFVFTADASYARGFRCLQPITEK